MKAGQQEVVIFRPSFFASIHSFASLAAVISAPRPTSTISAKPTFFSAARREAMPTSFPNWPSEAGAHMAMTSLPALMASIMGTRKMRLPMAPKGQAWMQWPQCTHLFSSMLQKPYSSQLIASTGQIFLQGRSRWMIAP